MWKKSTEPSFVHKELLYGEKIAKIGPVYPEIFDKIRQFFGRVVPDVHKIFGSYSNVPRDIEIKISDLPSTEKALFHGEKFLKIGPVYPEIFDKICQFFGCVIRDDHK